MKPSPKELALDLECLRSILCYEPETGVFTWKVRRAQHVLAGDRAGSLIKATGYRCITIDLVQFFEHRLAFFMMTGCWPKDEVDHINQDKADNRWGNLREATHTQNHWNRPIQANNKTGERGIHLRNGRYAVQLKVNQYNKWVGTFDTLEEAKAAREAGARAAFGDIHPGVGGV